MTVTVRGAINDSGPDPVARWPGLQATVCRSLEQRLGLQFSEHKRRNKSATSNFRANHVPQLEVLWWSGLVVELTVLVATRE
jgi:hypothetical protein